MSFFKKTTFTALALLFTASALAQTQPMPQQTPSKPAPQIAPLPANIVAGKIIAVTQEKVSFNNQWLDRVSLKVDSCDAPGTLKNIYYGPGTISEHTALGHLLQQNYTAALMPNLERMQQSPNGLGLFWVTADGRILRTGLLGSQTGCKEVPRMIQQFK